MKEYQYEPGMIRKDLLLALAGAVLVAIPLVQVWQSWVGLIILLPLFVLISVFGLRAWRRGRVVVRSDETGIHVSEGGERSRFIEWQELRELRVRYYGARKAQDEGGRHYLEMCLTGGQRQRIRIESSLDGFLELLTEIVEIAHQRGLKFDDITRDNLRSMGLAS